MTASSTASASTPPSSLVMNGNGQPVIMNGATSNSVSNGSVANGRLPSNGLEKVANNNNNNNNKSTSQSCTAAAAAAAAAASSNKKLKKRPSDLFTLIIKIIFIQGILKPIVQLYTYLTLPFYWLAQKPSEALQKANFIRASPMVKGDPSSPWVSTFPSDYKYVLDEVETIDEMMNKVHNYFNLDRKALGYRRVIREHVVTGPDGVTPLRIDGRPVKKRELSDYNWITYEEMIRRKNNIARGFHLNGVKQRDRVVILCETCAEYLMVELAIANAGAVQVNVFSTLGDSGIAHAVQETESKFIFTSFELLEKTRSIIKEYDLNIEKVFYTPRRVEEVSDEEQKECDRVVTNLGETQFISFSDIEQDGEERGHEVEDRCRPLHKDEIAFISKCHCSLFFSGIDPFLFSLPIF